MTQLEQWLDEIRSGDKVAFEALYENTKNLLYTIIFQITQDVTLSEDVLQELFLKIYLSPPTPSANPRAYLCRMARNLAIDSVRKLKPHCNWEQAENILSHMDDISQSLAIEDAIRCLPERERQIITLHIHEEVSFREIAIILDLSLGTVFWAYQRAIKQLRNFLGGIP